MRSRLLLGFCIGLVLVLTNGLYYYVLKAELAHDQHAQKTKLLSQIEALGLKVSQTNQWNVFEANIALMQNLYPFDGIEIWIYNQEFLVDSLLEKASLNPQHWSVGEITLDASLGEIKRIDERTFSFVSIPEKKSFHVRFQAYNASTTRDFLIPFSFFSSYGTMATSQENTLHIKNPYFALNISMQQADTTSLLKEKMVLFSFFTLVSAGFVFLLLFFYHRFAYKNPFKKTLAHLNVYLKNTLEGTVSKDAATLTSIQEMRELQDNIQKLSKHFLTTLNELNVARDILHQKEILDELTGLPNKKKFEYDLKHMFIANKEGFVIYLKMDKIGIFTKNHGPQNVDALIEDFSHLIKNYFNSHRAIDGTIYRFFGGEFSILLYEKQTKRVEEILQEIINLTEKLSDKFYFFDNAIHYGATPFNAYGSVESIIQSAQDAFELALKDETKNYFVSDAQHQLERNQKLEKTVQDIIARNDFVLQYLDDTFDFSIPPKLLMQHITPLLIDSYTFETIPSNTFMSVAEKLGVIADFEKALIQKAVEQIELGELAHAICITLSHGSYSHKPFLSWLAMLLSSHPNAAQLIFSIPAYSAMSNYDAFLDFSQFIHKHSGKIFIEKYTLEDLPIEKLKLLSPDYLRLDKEYVQNFKQDATRQRSVKKVILAVADYNIRIIAHGARDSHIANSLEALGIDGICH